MKQESKSSAGPACGGFFSPCSVDERAARTQRTALLLLSAHHWEKKTKWKFRMRLTAHGWLCIIKSWTREYNCGSFARFLVIFALRWCFEPASPNRMRPTAGMRGCTDEKVWDHAFPYSDFAARAGRARGVGAGAGSSAGCGAGGSGAGLSGYLEDDAGESLHGWIKLYFCAAFSFFGRCSIIYYLSVQKSTQTGKERLR